MNSGGLDFGLGLASIGIITFIGTILASSIFLPTEDEGIEGLTNLMTYYCGVDDSQFIFSIGVQIGTILFAIFLIRRWSNQWNQSFN